MAMTHPASAGGPATLAGALRPRPARLPRPPALAAQAGPSPEHAQRYLPARWLDDDAQAIPSAAEAPLPLPRPPTTISNSTTVMPDAPRLHACRPVYGLPALA